MCYIQSNCRYIHDLQLCDLAERTQQQSRRHQPHRFSRIATKPAGRHRLKRSIVFPLKREYATSRVQTGVREEQNSNLVDVLYNMHFFFLKEHDPMHHSFMGGKVLLCLLDTKMDSILGCVSEPEHQE
jgi:hypothetical protein